LHHAYRRARLAPEERRLILVVSIKFRIFPSAQPFTPATLRGMASAASRSCHYARAHLRNSPIPAFA